MVCLICVEKIVLVQRLRGGYELKADEKKKRQLDMTHVIVFALTVAA